MQSFEPLLKRGTSGIVHVEVRSKTRYVFEMVLEEARNMVQASQGNFYFFNDQGELYPFDPEIDSSANRALCEKAIANRTKISSSDEETDTTFPCIVVPLILQEGVAGAIILRNPIYFSKFFDADVHLVQNFCATFTILLQSSFFDPDFKEIYLNFKSSLLLLLETAHLNRKIKESTYQLKAVLEISNMINSSRELNELILAVLYSAQRVTRAESASLFLIDEKTGELVFDLITDDNKALRGLRIPQGQGIAGLCASEKKSIMVNDAQNDPRLYRVADEVGGNTTRNLLASPLIVDEKAIGVIEVINTIDRAAFTDQDLDIFESFSDSVAVALQRRRLLDDLQRTNSQLEKRLREITSLHSVNAVLVESRSQNEVFSNVLRIIQNDLNVNKSSILLWNENSRDLELVAQNREFKIKDQALYPESLAKHVYEMGDPVFIRDIQSDPHYSRFAKNDRYNSTSCILIPMKSAISNQPFGVLCVSDPAVGHFYEEDFRLLSTITSQMVRGYENIKLNEEIAQKKAIEKEVEITSNIQKNILPHRSPRHRFMDLNARCMMAKTTGGDFFDYYVESESGAATMLVADVSGKSLPAALFMAVSSSIIRTIIRSEDDPTRILKLANELLYEESESGMFVTVFLARFEPALGKLFYASAGHNDMLLIRKDGTTDLLKGKGPPLGVLPSSKIRFHGGEASVTDEDTLVLYTDGVVEAVDQENQEFGIENFVRLMEKNRDLPPSEMIDLAYSSVIEFAGTHLQYDDFTMLITRFKSLLAQKATIHLPATFKSIPRLREFINQVCMRNGVQGSVLEDILLAGDEAATNIVMHAYKGAGEDNPGFDCEVEIEAGSRCSIKFEDKGNPFRLEDVRSPDLEENMLGKRKGGFGVYLIKSLMDDVQYERINGVNQLKTEKRLS